MKHLAFTGTQQGMTEAQRVRFRHMMTRIRPEWFHHGDCIGADAQAHDEMRPHAQIHIHPCTIDTKRAYKTGSVRIEEPLPPLERNRVLVDVSEELIATPKEMAEELRSGTWATIRYARKQKKPVHICWPDGTYTGPIE